MKYIKKYKNEAGVEPFNEWFQELDWVSQAKIDAYIIRVANGNTGNIESVGGGGVFEIKVNYGPGYRVYFGQSGKTIIVLLLGGDKSTQRRDINKAIEFWKDYHAKNG